MSTVLTFIVSVISGAISGIGVGGGTILLIFMSLFLDMPQLKSQYINLLYFIPTAIFALIIHRKNKLIIFNIALSCVFFGIIGALCGALVATLLDSALLKKIFAIILFFIGFEQLLKK